MKEIKRLKKSENITLDECIDISTLQIEQTFKSYADLCKCLNQPSGMTGNQRKSQEKEFKRYFDWVRVGTGSKIMIIDIYNEPLQKEDGRANGNNTIYVKNIEFLMMSFLAKQNDYTYSVTKRNWWQILGMVNSKYQRVDNKSLKDLDICITDNDISSFYCRCYRKLDKILHDALKSLSDRKLIIYEIQTIIAKHERGKTEYVIVDDEEKKIILKTERKALKSFGYENINQIYFHRKEKEYFSKVKQLLYNEFKWDGYHKEIKIIFNRDQIQEAIPETFEEIQKHLNESIVDALHDKAVHDYQKAKEKSDIEYNKLWESYGEFGISEDASSSNKIWIPPITFVQAHDILADELLKIGKNNIKSKDVLDVIKNIFDMVDENDMIEWLK